MSAARRKSGPIKLPTIRQELKIMAMWKTANQSHPTRIPKIAKRVGLPAAMVRRIVQFHQVADRKNTIGGPAWYGEREVKPDVVVRCPVCRAKLEVYVPGHPCRECRLKEHFVREKLLCQVVSS